METAEQPSAVFLCGRLSRRLRRSVFRRQREARPGADCGQTKTVQGIPGFRSERPAERFGRLGVLPKRFQQQAQAMEKSAAGRRLQRRRFP